jgi:hypothetical protein
MADTKLFFIKAKEGIVIKDPETRKKLSESGELKPRNTFWKKRVSDGEAEIILRDTEKPEPAKKESKKKDELI